MDPAAPLLHIVLVEPEIPPNTGNVARLCAVARCKLHLIEPLGFRLDEAALRRAGMDYWKQVDWQVWPNWRQFAAALAPASRCWFIESGGPQRYDQVQYREGDFVVFGRETAGLPLALLEANRDGWLKIPMLHADVRSLNLSNCVALVAYEALRQLGFPGAR